MAEITLTLPDHLSAFVQAKASEEGYASVADYIAAVIQARKVAEARERVEALILEGLHSGDPIPATPEEWQKIRDEIEAEISAIKGKA